MRVWTFGPGLSTLGHDRQRRGGGGEEGEWKEDRGYTKRIQAILRSRNLYLVFFSYVGNKGRVVICVCGRAVGWGFTSFVGNFIVLDMLPRLPFVFFWKAAITNQ